MEDLEGGTPAAITGMKESLSKDLGPKKGLQGPRPDVQSCSGLYLASGGSVFVINFFSCKTTWSIPHSAVPKSGQRRNQHS
jgi:hypothetical protein